MSPPSKSATTKPDMAFVDQKLPTCRNYWNFGSAPSRPQRPPSYLLKPHLIASSGGSDRGRNPNSKYFKLRHGPGAQFSPLNGDMIDYHQYRVRLPFDPTPFRGVTRFAFWIFFLSVLLLLAFLLTALFSVEDLHNHHPVQNVDSSKDDLNDIREPLSDSLIFKALMHRNVN